MTTTIEIASPNSNAAEIAVNTREKLAAWVASVQGALDEPAMAPIEVGEKAAMKEAGAMLFMSELNGRTPNFAGLMNSLNQALSTGDFYYADRDRVGTKARSLSYKLEGICNAFSRAFHEAGLKWEPALEYQALMAMEGYLYNGQWSQPYLIDRGINPSAYGAYNCHDSWNVCYDFRLDTLGTEHAWQEQKNELKSQFEQLPQSDIVYYRPYKPDWARDDEFYRARRIDMPHGPHVMLWRYTDHDGDWVAGFLSPKDMARCRFSRKRLGAVLTDSGVYSEMVVRSHVELAKNSVATARFVLYPNDCNFGDIYVKRDHVRSCMADDPCDYNSDGIHPTQVYSSSYMGAGDNGLVLFTSQTEDGDITGRGIWNAATGNIVRWYGAQVPARTLKRLGVEPHDGDALEGSWLALHKFGARFVHPYVDGDIEYGTIIGNRVELGRGADHCLYETEGSSCFRDTHYCDNTDAEEDADECTYQTEHENWVRNPQWTCPVLSEWCDPYQRTTVWLDGEEQEISNLAFNRHVVITDPTDEMIQEDMDAQDWESEEEDGPFEYNGPENYTSTY